MVLRSVFIIAIVAVAMIGVMVPNTFAAPCMTPYWYSENFVDGKIPPCTSADGKNFSDQNLKHADFSYMNLSGANFTGADLSYADLSYADLSYADLSDANLSRAKLFQADLSNANLENTNLKGASLPNKEPTPNVVKKDGYVEFRDSSFELTINSNAVSINHIIKPQSKLHVSSSEFSNYESVESSPPNWKPATVPDYESSIPNWKPATVPDYESVESSPPNWKPATVPDYESSPPNWKPATVPDYELSPKFKLDTSHTSNFEKFVNKYNSAPSIPEPKYMNKKIYPNHSLDRDIPNIGRDLAMWDKYGFNP
jgi:hypothetical protein